MSSRFLVDKSALSRMPLEPVKQRLSRILASGDAATCAIIDLEVLYSARNHEQHERIRRRRELAYEQLPMDESVFARAIEVQGILARKGRHRLPIPDLLIAAVAERHGLTVLHYDSDFDTISAVTGQPCEWVVERGTVA